MFSYGEICYGRSRLYTFISTREKREEKLYMKTDSSNETVFGTLLIQRQSSNIVFFSFFLRTLLFLPLEAVSMYFGAVKADFKKYMLGSILGMLPNMVISTIMCDNISKPASPAFFVSVVLFILISVIAVIWYAKYIKKEDKH